MGLKPGHKIQQLTCSQCSIHLSKRIRNMKGDWMCLLSDRKCRTIFEKFTVSISDIRSYVSSLHLGYQTPIEMALVFS
jgi:hypothetical protein